MERDASQRGRAGKLARSSVDSDEERTADHPQHISTGERNGQERVRDLQAPPYIEDDFAGSASQSGEGTLARLAEAATRGEATGPQAVSTIVVETDADDWLERDLAVLAATDLAGSGSGVAPRVTSSTRRFPSIDLRIDERLGRILLAVVLAVLLWFYVSSSESRQKTTLFTGFTIEVRNAPSQLRVINPLPTVDVTVQGPRNILDALSTSDIHPYIDLKGQSEGTPDLLVLVDVNPDKQHDLTVTVSPSKVQVQLELQVTQVFTVATQINGAPAVGYKLESVKITPNEVRVTGRKSVVARVARVMVPIDLEGRASIQQGSKTPVAQDSNGQLIDDLAFEPATVQVEAPIRLMENYRTVPVKPNLVGQPSPGYQVSSIRIDPTNVTICCSANLEQIDQLETNPVVISGTTATVVTSTALLLPQNVQLYFDQPRQTTITITVEPIQTTIKLSVVPTVQGLAAGFSGVVSPGQIELTLSGTFNQLQNLSPTDIRAAINADGRGAGTYTARPQISVPDSVKLESSSPEDITLTIIAPTPLPTQPPTPTLLPTRTPIPQPQPTATQTAEETEGTATPGAIRATATASANPTTSPVLPPATPTSPAPVATATSTITVQAIRSPEAQTAPTAQP